MDKSQLAHYQAHKTQTSVHVSEISGPDRTLLVGRDVNASGRVHVYLKDGLIHRAHLTFDQEADRYVPRSTESFETVAMDHLIPSKRCFPERCDLDFTLLAARLGTYAPTMTTFDDEVYAQVKDLDFYEAL